MKEHPNFPWDHFSDQPCILQDKKLKRKIYFRSIPQYFRSILLLPFLPLFIVIQYLKKRWLPHEVGRCLGLAVHVETPCEGKQIVPLHQLKEMVDELEVKQLLIRIPLAEADNIGPYIEHIDALSAPDREIAVTLLQNRLLLDDREATQLALEKILPLIRGKTKYIHVGSAYNRRKWAIYHFGEYFQFFQTIRKSCTKLALEMELIGGSIIDFEIPPLMESLFHFRRGHYDGLGLQLYVDRRGAPENSQLGFNFLGKINLIDSMRSFSWNTKGSLWISEINWPLKNTNKFAPCYGSMLVDVQTQANYLVRAYLLAMASGKIRTCYWHQLIAPGYGLVDNRGITPDKRPSFYAFKQLNTLFNGATIKHFHEGNYQKIKGLYCLHAENEINGKFQTIKAFWSNDENVLIPSQKNNTWLNQSGDLQVFDNPAEIYADNQVLYALS